jgi:hypothetical protein
MKERRRMLERRANCRSQVPEVRGERNNSSEEKLIPDKNLFLTMARCVL